ncbi:MAG: hypothetical protein IH908_06505 [Proteobacteria bacterium]|nr:hypothetical protein [Pseudomonadota bacterium]TDJ25375.1 MAG: hypothetical protein E2O59_11245 [Gammaproteobacteria bacterium]
MDTDRIYQGENDRWFFNVRGNEAMGPYETYPDADRALAKHVNHYRSRTDVKARWPRMLHPSRLWRRSAARHT